MSVGSKQVPRRTPINATHRFALHHQAPHHHPRALRNKRGWDGRVRVAWVLPHGGESQQQNMRRPVKAGDLSCWAVVQDLHALSHLGHQDERLVDIVVHNRCDCTCALGMRHLPRAGERWGQQRDGGMAHCSDLRGAHWRLWLQCGGRCSSCASMPVCSGTAGGAPAHLDIKRTAFLVLAAGNQCHPGAVGGPLWWHQRLTAASNVDRVECHECWLGAGERGCRAGRP